MHAEQDTRVRPLLPARRTRYFIGDWAYLAYRTPAHMRLLARNGRLPMWKEHGTHGQWVADRPTTIAYFGEDAVLNYDRERPAYVPAHWEQNPWA